ncbi:murein DD-endopeptidase MepM/ murein hydrolase activator NlpD [Myroides gitamensis]|uniref:murein hydrolase activator EnvC family protein n=1 Tax=Myroides odoratus TaxID=256 RepID=UPI002166CF94|nr:M23 family metallopeptidase [Myroides odoratus]MCS4239294.1 murein DD-endopeptidase MepM/ murein hydrolase activator NlpD [Myroides odoratus]MDH6602325.1 murein DD-endopeptidase MepM/ murein hydrolase activator NlpD [Myroides gitamensis]
MSKKGLQWKKWKKRLLDKYRVVVVNDRTFEDVSSFKLNLLNVVGATTTMVFLLLVSNVILLLATPLKEYIPGYSSAELKQKAVDLALKVDSLESEIKKNEHYVAAVQRVLLGDIEITSTSIDSLMKTDTPLHAIEHTQPSEKDLELREYVRLEDKYNIFTNAEARVSTVLFAPIEGTIVRKYDPKSTHFGLDFTAAKNAMVKSVAKGTVIFVDWTIKDGYTVIVLHEEGVSSVYKHLSSLTKSVYETVQAGDVLGLYNQEEVKSKMSQPYLHFELWKDNYPLDPTLFIDLE